MGRRVPDTYIAGKKKMDTAKKIFEWARTGAVGKVRLTSGCTLVGAPDEKTADYLASCVRIAERVKAIAKDCEYPSDMAFCQDIIKEETNAGDSD